MHTSLSIVLISTILPILAIAKSTTNSATKSPDIKEPTSEDLWKYMVSATSLQYDDTCSWDDEVARQKLLLETQNLRPGSQLKTNLFNQFVLDSNEKERKFCTSFNMLVCDKDTQKCICGEAAAQVGLGDEYKTTSYVRELGDDGKTVCRWGQSTACSPISPRLSQLTKGSTFAFPTCANGLQCVSTNNNNNCSYISVLEYAFKHLGKTAITYGEFKKDLFSGKVCSCLDGHDSQNGKVDDDEEDVNEVKTRNKRNVDDSLYEHAMNVLSPHFDI